MTPTASASPITLLTSVVAPAASASNAANNAASDAANKAANAADTAANAETDGENRLLPTLNGGFQLLIDAAAQQQLTASTAAKTVVKPTNASDANSPEGGNVLPLLGALLPTTSDPATAAQGASDKTDDTDGDTPTADQSAADTAAVQLLWVPVNVQAPPPAPNTNIAVNANTTTDTGSASSSGVALLTTPSAAVSTAVADNALQVADTAAPAQPNGSLQNQQANVDRNTKTHSDVLVTPSNSETKLDVAPQDLIGAAQKPSESASFADLLKPANTATATNPLTAPLETGRTQQQTARSYAEVNNTGASVAVPVGSSGWSDAVVDKVMWFSANKFSSAEIQLNPPDLGPLQVRISTQHDQATVVFSSPHQAVRDALDQALPRLRDMLGGQGIQLSDASVGGQGAQPQQHQSGERRAPTQSFFPSDDSSIAPTAITRVQGPRLATSAVDAYA